MDGGGEVRCVVIREELYSQPIVGCRGLYEVERDRVWRCRFMFHDGWRRLGLIRVGWGK